MTKASRTSAQRLSGVQAVALAPVLAVGPGLPRTYQVQRLDSSKPAGGGVFGRAMASAGDLDRDGEDDLLLPQQANSPNDDGQVFVISGETGALIDTLLAPDPGNPVNCGLGKDRILADRGDSLEGCERVKRTRRRK